MKRLGKLAKLIGANVLWKRANPVSWAYWCWTWSNLLHGGGETDGWDLIVRFIFDAGAFLCWL